MKSSGSVFTRQNPFPPASTVRRAHYHPSRKQSLSKKEKKTTLSPVRSNQSSSQQPRSQTQETQQLNENHDDGFSVPDGHAYRETWPSTERGSSPDMLMGKWSAQPETVSSGVQDESVHAKYVERFHHGQPWSREGRQQMASASGEEWWASHSSVPSSTPSKAEYKDGHDPASYSPAGQHKHDTSFCVSVLSDSSQSEFDDTEILNLQERASNLLLRGDGSIPVSSDGLGCSDFSSPVTVEEPVRQPSIPIMIKPTADSVYVSSSPKNVIPALASPARPEEDILFQWRLRRKMEQARELSQSAQCTSYQDAAFSWQPPALFQPSPSRQPYKQQQSSHPPQFSQRDVHLHDTAPQPETREPYRFFDPCPSLPILDVVASGSSASQTQALAHVPAHMHLLCDILPCSIQSSHAKEEQNVSKRLDQPQTKVVHKKTKVPEGLSEITSEERMISSLHATIGTGEAEVHSHQKVPEKNRKKNLESGKKTAPSTRQQRKSPRNCSHQNLPTKATTLKEQHRQEGSRKSTNGSRTSDHEPRPSPVHTALGQAVSEVLFPAAASSPPQKISVSSVSLPHTTSSSQPLLPSHNSLEVISQLLQEAEDSDEKEFEDDPLLQVLRQQRKWVKDQISEVNVMLNEFLEEQQVT